MNEEMKGLQAQIDLMSRVIAELTASHSRGMSIQALAFKAAQEKSLSDDPVVARAAKEWGDKWFPHKPYMDDPMYQ